MGVKINAQKGENPDYVQSVKEMCRIAVDRTLSPIKLYKWTFKLTSDYFTQKKLLPVLHDFTYKVIDEKISDLENSEKNNGKKMAFLDLLLKFSENGKVISYDEIREEVDTFMFEGHDTTSSAICFALFSLANNPNVQDKVYKEQRELFGNEKDPLITYQELQDMKYLELVIKETLRLYPSVPIVGRMTTEDIEFCGSIIPKYTNIFIYIYGLHRDPQFFPDPEKFNPERFEKFDGSHPYAYIPFSAGQRNCIGQRFAMLELKSAISKVVRHFELIPAVPEHKLLLAAESTIKSANGIKVGLKKRISN